MLKEFRDFIARGNVMDMAVGIIVGAAFTGIVTSLVNDMLKPVIGLMLGGTDFTNYFISLDGSDYPTLAEAKAAGAATFNYGAFITSLINFLIIAFVVFMLVKAVNRIRDLARREEEQARPEPMPEVTPEPRPAGRTQEELLAEIRDLLARQQS